MFSGDRVPAVFPDAPIIEPIAGLDRGDAGPASVPAPAAGVPSADGGRLAPDDVAPTLTPATAVVQPGESLVDLADRVLGDPSAGMSW